MDGRPEPARLQKRNVEVVDSTRAIIAGFWQYGTLDWQAFYRCLTTFIVTREDWSIFRFDPDRWQHGAPCPRGPQIVQPGHYILLSTAGTPIAVGLVATRARPRHPSRPSTPVREHPHPYMTRGCARDGKCLITGLRSQTYSRLEVAHIFPRAHAAEWERQGHPSNITDPADDALVGGLSKIDSVQNVITLRRDLHAAWDNYEFGVDPDNDYRTTAFTNGNADIDGLHLQLDHIQDRSLRPLDALFTDHYMQCILMHMKGTAEPEWTFDDVDAVFGGDTFDMSNPRIWGTTEGKKRFELVLADRLLEHRVGTSSGPG